MQIKIKQTVEPLYFGYFLYVLKELLIRFSYDEMITNIVSCHINDFYKYFFLKKGVTFHFSREFSTTEDDKKIVAFVFEFLNWENSYREIYRIRSQDDFLNIYGGRLD